MTEEKRVSVLDKTDEFILSIKRAEGDKEISVSAGGSVGDLTEAIVYAMEEREDFREVLLKSIGTWVEFKKYEEEQLKK